MRIAITRGVPATITACELTHLARQPIDLVRAIEQHRAYESAIEDAGCRLVRLPTDDRLPDSVFVEDTAVVLGELAVVTRPGAVSRRPEVSTVAAALGRYRPLVSIDAPGTLDGGDVIVAGRTVMVGVGGRTNREGLDQLARCLAPFNYTVRGVTVRGCLHLKSAATLVSESTLLVNPAAVDAGVFTGFETIPVDPGEPAAANVLSLGSAVLVAEAFPRTRERLEARGVTTRALDMRELAKAEGALTCCSLLFDA